MPAVGRGCHRRRAGPAGRAARAPRGGALRRAAGRGMGDRRRPGIPAPGPADDRPARAADMEPARQRMVAAQLPPRRMAARAADTAVRRLAAAAAGTGGRAGHAGRVRDPDAARRRGGQRVVLLLLHPERMPGELARMTRHWREELLPRYRRVVAAAQAAAAAAPAAELAGLIEQVGQVAGEYSWSVATLAGSQWKIEAALTQFCRAHVPGLGASPQVLVSGLAGTEPDLPPHALHSIDWYWPTAGELGTPGPGAEILHRHRELAARREAAESACRAALAGRRRLRRRFDRLLSIAQTYAVVREQQTRQFSLGWPVLRRCALQLGAELARRRTTGRPEDVFFLTHAELESALRGASLPSPETVRGRRERWERQRRLIAPLQLGKAPALARRTYIKAIEAARTGAPAAQGALVGDPASPGRATGPVRVILDPGDFASFQPGEVMVARATAPAWTPLFAKAAAVITDGGTLAAHASLVAREYGIPAVVATGDATTRLHDRQVVTVDGGSGVVEFHG